MLAATTGGTYDGNPIPFYVGSENMNQSQYKKETSALVNHNRVSLASHLTGGLAAILAACALILPCAAHAQLPGIAKQAFGFLNTGGYFFSGNTSALGTPKFYSSGGYYTKPAHLAGFTIAGGIETVNATDHFIPFTGGNEFNLLGPAFKLSTDRRLSRLSPFATFGLFAGRVRSVRLGFDRTEFTPSGSVGLEFPISRDFSITGAYRISSNIHGVNTDGFSISLRVF